MSFFSKVVYLEKVLSTNSYLKEGDHFDKTLVYTFDQTNGRGRENRKWLNFKGRNLALSVLFRPNKKVLNFLWYIAINSLALVDLLERYGLKGSYIKWPNDIYIDDKKIAGVLAESVWKGDVIDKIIVGIGVNINSSLGDIMEVDKKATSLLIESNKMVDINEFTNRYILNLERYFKIFYNDDGVERIKEKWLLKNNIIGKKVKWIFDGSESIGVASGLDEDGFLLLKNGNEVIKIISGDIILI